tara:strand:- start:1067 stop:1429 length:363 start_codon:yes stop_codon:yes gene_type:complete
MSQHVEVKKLSPIYVERNATVIDPKEKRRIKPQIEGYNVFVEAIRIDQIKSFKEYMKKDNQKFQIDGDVTLLYLKSDSVKTDRRSDDSEDSKGFVKMMINENFDVFSNRIGSIKLPPEEE